ncbi:MAG: adenylate/guanylate cyclase domain-containing protein [Opitutaceae bacterium]
MLKNLRVRPDWGFLFLLPIPLLWGLIAHRGLLERLENQLVDLRFRLRGEIAAPVKLIYVDVDNRALGALGERPWNREQFGFAAEVLMEQGGARAIGFDFVFSAFAYSHLVDQKKAAAGNISFARVVRKHPGIVLGVQYTEGQGVTQSEETPRRLPLLRLGDTDRTKNDVPEMPQSPLVAPMWGRVGLIDFDKDYGGDEVPRWVPMFAHTMNPTLYPVSLQLVLLWLGLDEQAVKIYDERLDLVRPNGQVALAIPLREKQLVEVNWFSRWNNDELNPRVSLADVLGHRAKLVSEKPEERAAAEQYFTFFRGAIVLIGPTDALLQDLAPTGFELTPAPKVGMHGNLVKTLLSEKFIHRLPVWAMWIAVLGLTLPAAWLAKQGGARGLWFKIAALALIAAYVGTCLFMFNEGHIVLPMAAPLGAALSTSFIGVLRQLIREEKQKSRIKGMFGTYLAPSLVAKMVDAGEEPKLGGVEENITAYFSDIQSFSTFSEKLTPPRLVELMNEYLTACTDIVQADGATLDKYIGDAVVAIYGAPLALPDHAYRACVSALRVHQRIAELREKWRHETEKAWPELVLTLQTRIGLNSGSAIVGNMGSTSRFNYTMMGDNVNLAARMESGAKSWGVYSMCTESTRLGCEKHGGNRVLFRPLGKIVVKGRTQAVPIFEIVGLRENVPARAQECSGVFAQALEKYYGRDWAAASRLFAQSRDLEFNVPGQTPGVVSNPSLVYLERVIPEALREEPPKDWDGAYRMKEK